MESKEFTPDPRRDQNRPLPPEMKGPNDRKPGEPHPEDRKPEEPRPEKRKPEPIITLRGIITEWRHNKEYVYDGFIIQTQTEDLAVKFPPHLGEALKAGIQNNQEVLLKVVLHVAPKGEREIRFVSMESAGQIVNDIPPVHQPASDTFIEGSGIIRDFKYNHKGDIDGYVLDTDHVLNIPPHICNEFRDQAFKGDEVRFSGMQKSKKTGEVKAAEYLIIHTKTLSLRGREYSI